MPHLISVQAGLPRRIEAEDGSKSRSWISGIFKEPVEGPVWLGKTNLAGDGQANRKVHGGPDKAALAYVAEHYPFWREELNLDLQYGAFGENFTVSGLTENEVCIGDIYAVGDEAVVQISQPHQSCSKLSRKFKVDDLVGRVHISGRTGWYFRVLKEGYVERGSAITLLERPCPERTVLSAYRVRFDAKTGIETAVSFGECASSSSRPRDGALSKA